MKAAGNFGGFPQPKTCFGKRTLKECTSGKVDNIVLIDVDSDDFHNVIILDLPESLELKLKKKSACTVISIDEEEEENTGGMRGDTDAASSNGCFPASASPSSIDLDSEDCLFVGEETSPMNLSSCKRTYSGKAGPRNHYGLGSEFESYLSESDCSDCEVMEGSSGRLREQWEQASKRKNYACNCQSGLENQAGPASDSGSEHNLGERVNEQAKDYNPSSSMCGMGDNEGLSDFTLGGDDNLRSCIFNQGIDDNEARQTTFSRTEPETGFTEDNLFTNLGAPCDEHFDKGCYPFCNKEKVAEEPSMPSSFGKDDDTFNQEKPSPQDLEHNIMAEPCSYNYQASFDEHFDFRKADNESFMRKHPGDVQADHEDVASGSIDEALLHACSTPFPYEQTKFKRQVNLTADEPPFQKFELYNEGAKSVASSEKLSHEEARNSLCEESLCGSRCSETESVFYHSSAMEVDEPRPRPSSENAKLDEKSDASPGVGAESSQDDVIIDRQKIKETDEYKRAMEEEWASRQRQLQLQAEEAQRLRKRLRAESMRIMDMERRQKQRLEEMRETQKKDKENMNLKEQLRAEVRKELNILELTCGDMASLLRSLGIHVEGGFYPTPHKVQAAYKRALLKFHPDRASRTDLRQQVEAEETFKLISRMKEKFLLA